MKNSLGVRTILVFLMVLVGAWAPMTNAAEKYWHENPLNRPVAEVKDLTALRAGKPLSLEAGLDAWKDSLALEMERYDDCPVRLRPEYQKVRTYLQWDPETFYIAVEAYDYDQWNHNEGGLIWDGDCAQIAVVIDKDKVWREFGFALTRNGPYAHCWEIEPSPLLMREFAPVGNLTPTGVKLRTVREKNRILYFAAVPCAELKTKALAAGDVIRFNLVVFDQTQADGPKFFDAAILADGTCAGKHFAPFARLKLVDKPDQMRSVTAFRASPIPNPSFEYGAKGPEGWKPETRKRGLAEWTEEEASSGHRALKFLVTAPRDVARWESMRAVALKPNTAYVLSARSKGNGRADGLRLRLKVDGQERVVKLPAASGWRKTIYGLNSGTNGELALAGELAGYAGKDPAVAYLDDLILSEGALSAAAPLEKREIACITDNPDESTVLSLKALYPGSLQIFDAVEAIDWQALDVFEKAVVIPRDPSLLKTNDWEKLKAFVANGKTAALDLASYAAMLGVKVETKTLPVASPWNEYQKVPYAQRDLKKAGEAIKAEEELPIPLAVIAAENEMSAGYPAGSEIPWFGQRQGRFEHRQIPASALPPGAVVTAKSNLGGGGVWIRQAIGKGWIYALDINSLEEMTAQWRERGSYNKYVPIQNALGHGIRYGTYWNYRVTWPQYLERMQALVKKYPALTLTVEGFLNGYNRYGICVGNPKGPVYVYTGNLHAQREYHAGLHGLYAFAAYLGQHAQESPFKERLAKIAVKIIPVVLPELYMGKPGAETPLPLTKWSGEEDNVLMAYQQHHGAGGVPPDVGLCFTLSRGGKWAAAISKHAQAALFPSSPTVCWNISDISTTNVKPVPIRQNFGAGDCSIVWDGYFDQFMYNGLAGIKVLNLKKTARLAVLAEHGGGFGGPEGYHYPADYDVRVRAREFTSALLSDQSCAALLASLLIDDPEGSPAGQ